MAFRSHDEMTFKPLLLDALGDFPALRVIILPEHLVEGTVDRAEGARIVFEPLSHPVVLLVRPAPFETEKLLES